ncbi:hypothetical protein [Sedimenticola sp.]|uniref:hypothetical protein n=1 Tax=Sedimenticola sp. TaxID=1940285 RepID=UPI003D0F17CC
MEEISRVISSEKILLLVRRLTSYLYFALLVYVMWYAWRVSGQRYIVAEQGLGYWMGIASGVMLLLMMVYPWRKRRQLPSWLGSVKFWFRAHLVLGITVPCLVVLHSNFSLGSFNSRVALYCMLLVAASGLIGRYLYIQVHYGLTGKRKKIRDSIDSIIKQVDGLRAMARRHDVDSPWNLSEGEKLVGLAEKGEWELRTQLRVFEQQLNTKLDSKHLSQFRKEFSRELRKVNKTIAAARTLLLFERLFSLWHVIHVPFFVMLVASAIFHVVAVHMY